MSSYPWLLVLGFLLQAEPGGPTLRGTVTDAGGQPLVGARVDIATAGPRVGRGLYCPSCYPDCQKSARTGAAGRFEIGDLDPTLKFRLLIGMPGKHALSTELLDPLNEGGRFTLEDAPTDWPAEHTVRGQIVDDLGLPVEGALIDPVGAKTPERQWGGRVDVRPTVSDAEGRFALFVPQNFLHIDLQFIAAGHRGLQQNGLAPGAQEHKIEMRQGARVTGRLLFEGQPVVGVQVAVVQIDRAADHYFAKAIASTTDGNGRFYFEYLPADESYAIFSVVGGGPQEFVVTTKRFKAYGNGEERDLGELQAVRALQLKGRLELPEGAALPDGCKISLQRDPAWDLIAVPVDAEGNFQIDGLPPEAYGVRVVAEGFRPDMSRVPYQGLRDNTFGLRLSGSIGDLRIPLIKDQ